MHDAVLAGVGRSQSVKVDAAWKVFRMVIVDVIVMNDAVLVVGSPSVENAAVAGEKATVSTIVVSDLKRFALEAGGSHEKDYVSAAVEQRIPSVFGAAAS